MLAWKTGVVVSCILLLLVPFWLVWPLGAVISLYLLGIDGKKRGISLTDQQILGALLGVWCALCCGLLVFFAR